jgi:hypothetical protein
LDKSRQNLSHLPTPVVNDKGRSHQQPQLPFNGQLAHPQSRSRAN